MADSRAFTSTPDSTNGNPVDITTVTNAAAQTVDRQCVSIGDPTTGTQRAAVSAASALKVDGSAVTQPVSGTVTAAQGTAAASTGAWPTSIVQEGGGQFAWVDSHALHVQLRDQLTGNNAADVSAAGALKVDGSAVTQPVSVSGTANVEGTSSSTSGSITSATSTVSVAVGTSVSNVATIAMHGTHAGITFAVEVSHEAATWYPAQARDNATGTVATSFTPGNNASASYDLTLGAFSWVRVRATAWTSGTASVDIKLSSMPYVPAVSIANTPDVAISNISLLTDLLERQTQTVDLLERLINVMEAFSLTFASNMPGLGADLDDTVQTIN